MNNRMNYRRVAYERNREQYRIGGVHKEGISSIYATDKQKRYIDHLRKLCDERNVEYPRRKGFHWSKEGCSNEIRTLLRQLERNGYDARGNYIDNKKGFLKFMEDRYGI